jgi:hypothetical protein
VPISVRGNNLKSKDDAPLVPYREVAMPIDAAISVAMPTTTNSARVLTGQLLSARTWGAPDEALNEQQKFERREGCISTPKG